MGCVNRFLMLSFIFLLLSSLMVLTIIPVTVQAATKPSIPQFSVNFVNHPYDVPPTTSTHPYTGVVTNTPGYRVDNWTIDVTIKNQHFTPYTDKDGTEFNLYYLVEVKGHFEDYWRHFESEIMQSKSGHTVVSSSKYYTPGYQLDFRVISIIGYMYNSMAGRPIIPMYTLGWSETSDYSKTQTFTIPDIYSPTTTSPPPTTTFEGNQTQLPNQPQLPDIIFTNTLFLLAIGALFAGVVATVVIVILKKYLKTPDFSKDSPQTTTHTEISSSYMICNLAHQLVEV